MNLKELLEKRMKLVADGRAIMDAAAKENRSLSAEEKAQHDAIWKDIGEIKDSLDRLTRQEAEERALNEPVPRLTTIQRADGAAGQVPTDRIVELRTNVCGDTRRIVIPAARNRPELNTAWAQYLLTGQGEMEMRALQKDSPTGGGYLSPDAFMAELIQAVDNLLFMRRISRVLPPVTTAESLGCPSLDADPADPTWVSELAVGSEDSTMAFGKRQLTPHPMAQSIKVSKTLLRRSAIPVETLVRDRLAYKSAVVQENAFLNGTGNSQPLGIFVASALGINTDRDVSTGNTITSITFDGLKSAKYALKSQYRGRATWLFHRDAMQQIDKLKDGEGRYIWQPSVVVGAPDTILARPVYESEYVPHSFLTTLYVGILGDFSNYWIVDALTQTIQVLTELYAATNQNGYISRAELDGMPVLAEAFARVKLA
jgi:HK97 family phage major capsid protein